MDPAYDPIDRGLRMLEDRWRLLLHGPVKARIMKQIVLGRKPWSDTFTTLASHPGIFKIINDLHCQVLPYLIKGFENSAIHHTPYAVSFMARIATSEGMSPIDIKRGVVAALLHDIGSGDSVLPKITEEMIEEAPPSDRERMRREGIAYRREHMEKGVTISRDLLKSYQVQHPHALTADDVDVILDIVGTHDDCKIPLMEEAVNRKWLLRPTDEDRLKHYHWEADALWMLCPEGILIDLEREKEEDTAENRNAKFQFNLALHKKIVTLYPQVYSPEEMKGFRFKGGLLYRSTTGYEMAMEFQREVESL